MFTTFLKDSFKYPFLNILDWIKLTIYMIIANLLIIFSLMLINDMLFEKTLSYVMIFVVMLILALIFLLGYGIEILKHSIAESRSMPDFNIFNNFIFGFKHVIISFVYLIIPILTVMVFSYVMGVSNYNFDSVLFSFGKTATINLAGFMPDWNVIGTLTVFLVICLIFKPFEIIAISRLVTTGSLKQALNLNMVWSEVKCLKKELILVVLVFFSVFSILGFSLSIFHNFSFGIFISLFGYIYMVIFHYRFIGLIYGRLEVKNEIHA